MHDGGSNAAPASSNDASMEREHGGAATQHRRPVTAQVMLHWSCSAQQRRCSEWRLLRRGGLEHHGCCEPRWRALLSKKLAVTAFVAAALRCHFATVTHLRGIRRERAGREKKAQPWHEAERRRNKLGRGNARKKERAEEGVCHAKEIRLVAWRGKMWSTHRYVSHGESGLRGREIIRLILILFLLTNMFYQINIFRFLQ